MKHFSIVFTGILAAVMTLAQSSNSPIPAYHQTAPQAGTTLPPILTKKQLAQQGLSLPAQEEGYKAATRASSIMYQMPCYCYCDRGHGHTSLRSCFEGTHGAKCGTCLQEALYAYQQSKRGCSVKKIRDGIERGDFKTIDLRQVPPL